MGTPSAFVGSVTSRTRTIRTTTPNSRALYFMTMDGSTSTMTYSDTLVREDTEGAFIRTAILSENAVGIGDYTGTITQSAASHGVLIAIELKNG